jgi:hypothetical protein
VRQPSQAGILSNFTLYSRGNTLCKGVHHEACFYIQDLIITRDAIIIVATSYTLRQLYLYKKALNTNQATILVCFYPKSP